MAEPWFRWRKPDEGQGYSIASREGLAVAIVFVVVSTVAAVAPPVIGHGTLPSVLLGALLFAACVAGLLATVRAHSDWQG